MSAHNLSAFVKCPDCGKESEHKLESNRFHWLKTTCKEGQEFDGETKEAHYKQAVSGSCKSCNSLFKADIIVSRGIFQGVSNVTRE